MCTDYQFKWDRSLTHKCMEAAHPPIVILISFHFTLIQRAHVLLISKHSKRAAKPQQLAANGQPFFLCFSLLAWRLEGEKKAQKRRGKKDGDRGKKGGTEPKPISDYYLV